MSGEKSNRICETYKNTVIPHGHHIYAKAYDIAKATLCAYLKSDHALPRWKCVLRCCAKFPGINLTNQETDDQYPDTNPSIVFHIYHLIAHCINYSRLPLTGKKSCCCKCQHDSASG